MSKEIKTFEDLLSQKWISSTCGSDSEDACIEIKKKGVVFVLPTTWGDYQPGCFDMPKEELEKAFNLILYAKDMYQLLSGLDTEEAKELIRKIQEEKNMK